MPSFIAGCYYYATLGFRYAIFRRYIRHATTVIEDCRRLIAYAMMKSAVEPPLLLLRFCLLRYTAAADTLILRLYYTLFRSFVTIYFALRHATLLPLLPLRHGYCAITLIRYNS